MDAQLPFADVPHNARGHLGLFFYEATLRVIRYVRNRAISAGKSLENVFEEFPFLLPYFDELSARQSADFDWEKSFAWFREHRENWEAAAPGWLPLRGLRDELKLSQETLLALVLTGLPEEEPRFASLFATLQHPFGQRRPSLSLVRDIIAEKNTYDADAWTLCKPLVESGFVEALNRDAPRSEWILSVPFPHWSALRGELSAQPISGTHYHAPDSLIPLSELVLPVAEHAQLSELPALLASGRARTIVVRGLPGTERLAVVGAVALALGRGILEFEGPFAPNDNRFHSIGPFCTLVHALPVFCVDLGPAEQSITINLRPESAAERLRILQKTLNRGPSPELAEIAQTFSLPGRYLRRATQLAESYAALDRRSSITCADVRQATRTINRQQLDSLATRLAEGGTWSHLVVRAPTEQALHHLERRCRHRERLSIAMGAEIPGGLNRGVRALFEGPSGTGKTLAARILAAELGLDLYRVDVAAIVNKYIGETEKNLGKVLSRAEDLDVILLLDEGDSLMTRRTDVKSAHDRYANLETNYLLQRLETYSGIVIVTTNVGNSIDSAFRRRIDVVVKFHLPDADERWRLWQVHLPATHAMSPAELEQFALRYEMTGGQIRNAAVQSALFAMNDLRELISSADLRSAIQVEFRKAGAAVPVEEVRDGQGHDSRISGFLSAIS